MMTRKAKMTIALSVCFIGAIFATDECRGKWAFHSQLLKEKLDTSWWRQFYPDDSWRIRCIFVDMDGDGEKELVSASVSEEEDRVGWVWKVFRLGTNGVFQQVYHTGAIHFLCHWYSFYKMTLRNGTHFVVGLKMEAGYMDKERIHIVNPTPDCVFTLTHDGGVALQEIKPNLDTCFLRENVVCIERLYPEWYFGYDFKPPRDVPHNPQTIWMPYRLPKGDLRRGGGIRSPKDFATFVREYRHEVKNRMGQNIKVTVYAVFLDADNDGDGDCYVSSDIERTTSGKYDWTLYLCRDGRFEKAKCEVYPIESRKDLCKLPVAVNVDKLSFCRVIRYDVEPTFVILDENDQSKSRVRDSITYSQTHRIEKLACEEFHED